MKTGDELYHKVFQSPRVLQITLRPNSKSGLKDQHDQDARESSNHHSESELSYGENRCGNIDYKIHGIPLSVVQQQDTNRTETVKKLIQKFESHPTKKSFLQDLNKMGKINTFSEESQMLIGDMNNTEIFEICEASSNRQCFDCSLYWEIEIVYCTCGRCSKSSQSTKKTDKNTNHVLSVPGYVIKSHVRGLKHGVSARQQMYSKAKERCCRKLVNPSMVDTRPFWKDSKNMTIPYISVRYWVD